AGRAEAVRRPDHRRRDADHDSTKREEPPLPRALLRLRDERVECDGAHAEHVRTPASALFASAIVAGVSFPTSTYAYRTTPRERTSATPDGWVDPSRPVKSARANRSGPSATPRSLRRPWLLTVMMTPFAGNPSLSGYKSFIGPKRKFVSQMVGG